MWSDNETAVDLLGYKHLVSAVTSIVRTDGLLPATIGVFGDWGGGKSSLLKMVEEELAKDKDTLVLTFNGWLFEGYEDAKSALMGVVLDEITAKRPMDEKAKATLKKLIKRVNWFRVVGTALKHGAAFALGGPAGLGLTVAADVAGYVKQLATESGAAVKEVDLETVSQFITEESGQEARKAIREFREDFKTLLHETHLKRLVVLIDDLDRCLPDSIIEILEAIKLFLFVDRTAFVIGADERLVRYAVRRRFPELPGDSVGVANEYLEKLIQYPVRIPALDNAEMETYVNLLFASKAPLLPNQFEKVRQHVLNVSAQSLLSVRFSRCCSSLGTATRTPPGR
jgi:predicted KAP-like P-loop ATPase